MRWILSCGIVLGVLLSSQAALKPGSTPPPLVLSTMVQGPSTPITGWNDLAGKVVVLEFWGVHCAGCIEAIPHWNALVEQFYGKPVVFLSVSDDNKNVIRDFLKKKAISGWVAEDGPLSATASAFDVDSIPHTFVIDAAGKVAASTRPSKLQAEHLEEILSGKPCSLLFFEPNSQADPGDEDKTEPRSRLAEISIRGPFPKPTANGGAFGFMGWASESCFEAKRAYLNSVLARVFNVDSSRIHERTPLPEGLYDITLAAPAGKTNELRAQFQAALKMVFGISVEVTNREVEVYSMAICSSNAPGRIPTADKGGGGQKPGGFSFTSCRMRAVADFLGFALNKPVIDDSHLTNRWRVDLKWEMTEGERLRAQLKSGVVAMVDTNAAIIISGHMPPELRATMTDSEYQLLLKELAKPEEQRFNPDPVMVIKAAREQLGVSLELQRRVLPTLEIRKADKGD